MKKLYIKKAQIRGYTYSITMRRNCVKNFYLPFVFYICGAFYDVDKKYIPTRPKNATWNTPNARR